jgi:hypothetical protein
MIRKDAEVPFCSSGDADADAAAGGGTDFGRGVDFAGAALDVLNIDVEPCANKWDCNNYYAFRFYRTGW